MNIKNNLRISLSLVCMTLLIVFAANWLNFMPNENNYISRERTNMSESLSILFSISIQNEEISTLPAAIQLLINRNPRITSITISNLDGTINIRKGVQIQERNTLISTSDIIRTPLFKDNEVWGSVEIEYSHIDNISNSSFFQLILFIAGFGFIVYYLLVRKVLSYLDPTKIIPHRVRTTLNAVADGMVFIDDRERIILSNKAFESSVLLNSNQLLGKNISSMSWTTPNNLIKDKQQFPWKHTLDKGDPCTQVRLDYKTSTDKLLSFIVNTTPLGIKDDEVGGALLSFTDITEIQKTSNNLENITKFLRHEMGNALVGAEGTLNLLEKSDHLSEHDKKIISRTKDLHSVIDRLLDSVKEAKSIEDSFSNEIIKPLNIDELLSNIVSNYSEIFNSNTFEYTSDNKLLIVQGHEDRFIQMIDKLTTNAIEHATPKSLISYSCVQHNDHIVIKISNEGAPLPENKGQIFDLFASFHSGEGNKKNQGIGLYVVKLIADSCGGTIEAIDRTDTAGAEFVIKLPLAR